MALGNAGGDIILTNNSMVKFTKRRTTTSCWERVITTGAVVGAVMLVASSVGVFQANNKDCSDFPLAVQKSENGNTKTSSTNDYSLALQESFGFFDDVDAQRWARLKKRFQHTRPNMNKSRGIQYKQHANHAEYFWMENYDPEFSCENELKLGKIADGGKWVCDPHRILAKKDESECLVYSVGSRGDFTFEEDVLKHVSNKCDIHTFDRDAYAFNKNFTDLGIKAGVNFHHTSLGPPTEKVPNGKRFKDIIPDLKHQGRTVDIMKIDCEGCEWDQFGEWFADWKEHNLTVRMLLIEVHQSRLPETPDFFAKMLELGYVIYHKEANTLNPKCFEYAFLLLDTAFQKKQEEKVSF